MRNVRNSLRNESCVQRARHVRYTIDVRDAVHRNALFVPVVNGLARHTKKLAGIGFSKTENGSAPRKR